MKTLGKQAKEEAEKLATKHSISFLSFLVDELQGILDKKADLPKDFLANPEKYQSPRIKVNFLLGIKLTPKKRGELCQCIDNVINYMTKTLKLEKWECYFIVKMLYQNFPIATLLGEQTVSIA